MMAEGLIVVPLYARQAPAELAGMMKDCAPLLICCPDQRYATRCEEVGPPRGSCGFRECATLEKQDSPRTGSSRRPRRYNDHLHLGHVRRAKGSGIERRKRGSHARLHERPARSADGRAKRAGQDIPLFAVLLRGIVDCSANRARPQQRAIAFHRSLFFARRIESCRARLFPECPHPSRKSPHEDRRNSIQARRLDIEGFQPRQTRIFAAPQRRRHLRRFAVSLARKFRHVSRDSQEHRS